MNTLRHNNWHVLTGAPCSGKTTLLKELENRKFLVFPEAARVYIDEQINRGLTLEQIRKDELLFQKKVLELKINLESELPKNEVIFLERGIPDSHAYYHLCGCSYDKKLLQACQKCHYRQVFLLQMVEYQQDYARTEDYRQAIEIEKLLFWSYKKFGFNPIVIPAAGIDQRLNIVLKYLN